MLPTDGSDVIIPNQTGTLTVVYDATAGTLGIKTLLNSENFTLSGGALSLGIDLTDISSFAAGTLFSQTSGSFGGAGTINILGDYNWSGGILAGAGLLDLSNAGSTTLTGSLTQNGMTLKIPELNLASNAVYTLNSGTITYISHVINQLVTSK